VVLALSWCFRHFPDHQRPSAYEEFYSAYLTATTYCQSASNVIWRIRTVLSRAKVNFHDNSRRAGSATFSAKLGYTRYPLTTNRRIVQMRPRCWLAGCLGRRKNQMLHVDGTTAIFASTKKKLTLELTSLKFESMTLRQRATTSYMLSPRSTQLNGLITFLTVI